MQQDNHKEFSILITIVRKLTGISFYELAQRFNTGAGTVSRWEHGHSSPPRVARDAIIRKLKGMIKTALHSIFKDI